MSVVKPSYLFRVATAWEAFRAEMRGQSFDFGSGKTGLNSLINWYSGSDSSDTQENVTEDRGTKISIVHECLNVLSQDISTLPFQLKQKTQDQGRKTVNNALSRLLNKKPNRYENAVQFWYSMVYVGKGWGNSYAYIVRNDRQEPTELIRLAPWCVKPCLIGGNLYYEIDSGRWTVPQRDIFHFRQFVTNGIEGQSEIIHNANLLGLKIRQVKYAEKSTSERTAGYLTTDKENIQKQQRDEIVTGWKASTSGDKMTGTPFLFGGVKYNQLMLSPEAAEMVEASNWTNTEICGIFRIQPTMVSQHKDSNHSNAEQQALNHVKFTLQPIITVIEQEADEKLISERSKNSQEPFYTKFNMKGLLRGDTEAQGNWYQRMLTSGVFSADEVREMEDLPPQPEGQGKYIFIQGAMEEKQGLIDRPNQDDKTAQRMLEELKAEMAAWKPKNGFKVHES